MRQPLNILFFTICSRKYIKDPYYIQKRYVFVPKPNGGFPILNKIIVPSMPKMPIRAYSYPAVYNNNTKNILEKDNGSQTGLYHKHLIELICDLPGCSNNVCTIPCSMLLYAKQKGVFTSSPETNGKPNMLIDWKNIIGKYKTQYLTPPEDNPTIIPYSLYDELKGQNIITPDHAGDNYVNSKEHSTIIHNTKKSSK